MAKRFVIETSTTNQKFSFISDHKDSRLYWASTKANPEVLFSYKKKNVKSEEILTVKDFVDVKWWEALGNKIEDVALLKVDDYLAAENTQKDGKLNFNVGDTLEFDWANPHLL